MLSWRVSLIPHDTGDCVGSCLRGVDSSLGESSFLPRFQLLSPSRWTMSTMVQWRMR